MLRFRREGKFLGLGFLLILMGAIPAVAQMQMQWVKNYDDALKQATKEKKFIILDVSASW